MDAVQLYHNEIVHSDTVENLSSPCKCTQNQTAKIDRYATRDITQRMQFSRRAEVVIVQLRLPLCYRWYLTPFDMRLALKRCTATLSSNRTSRSSMSSEWRDRRDTVFVLDNTGP